MANQTAETAKEQAQHVAQAAAEQGRSVAQTAQEQAGEVAGTVKEQLSNVTGEITHQGTELLNQAQTQLRDQADMQTQRLADQLRSYGDECTALCEGRPEDAPHLTARLEQAGARMNQMADNIEQRGVTGALNDVQAFARRRPGVFLIGAIGAGFLAGRVIKATRSSSQSQSTDQGQSTELATMQPETTFPVATPPTPGPYGYGSVEDVATLEPPLSAPPITVDEPVVDIRPTEISNDLTYGQGR